MTDYQVQVQRVIGDYVKKYGTLTTMNEINLRYSGESKEYQRWENAQKEYAQKDWDDSSWREFLQVAHDAVEGEIDTLSEAYLDILVEDPISAKELIKKFESASIEDGQGPKEGFQVQEKDGIVVGFYYYYTRDVDIIEDPETETYEVDEIPHQKRIKFRIIPNKKLVIIEDTRTARVGKLKSKINKKTSIEVAITGNLNPLPPEDAEEIVREFKNSFVQGEGIQ